MFAATLAGVLMVWHERPAAFVSCSVASDTIAPPSDSVIGRIEGGVDTAITDVLLGGKFSTAGCPSGHGSITRDALIRMSPTPAPAAIIRVAEADENVDASETKIQKIPLDLVPTPQYVPRHHFDRPLGVTSADAFAQGELYVQQERTAAQRLLNSGCSRTGQGLDAIGRALHAIQDVYSHSNYIDSNLGLPGLDAAARDRIDALLIAGTGSAPMGFQLTLFDKNPRVRVLADGTVVHDYEDPIPGGYSHKLFAKDSADKNDVARRGFTAAYGAAVAESQRFVQAVADTVVADAWNRVVRYQTASDPCKQPQSTQITPPPKPIETGLSAPSGQCAKLPELDLLLQAVNDCKKNNLSAKTTRVQSCMNWWLGWPTCTVPTTCTPLVDRYYGYLTGTMGMADRKSVNGGTMRAEAINGQIRTSCRNSAP